MSFLTEERNDNSVRGSKNSEVKSEPDRWEAASRATSTPTHPNPSSRPGVMPDLLFLSLTKITIIYNEHWYFQMILNLIAKWNLCSIK